MAAMTFDLVIWVDGETVPLEVQADQRDMAAFEVEHRSSSVAALSETPMLFFRFLGGNAAKRLGRIPEGVKFEDWLATVVEVEPADDETPDPGQPAVSDAPSSS